MPESAPSPDITVVIPTYNRGSQLRPLLDSLLQQDARGVRYEVLVVDNNSRDNTAAVIETARLSDQSRLIHYLFESRQGVSYARNMGIAHARAPIIAFLDDDGIPSRSWVYSLKRAFEEYPQADCIGGRVRPVWNTPKPSWLTAAHAGPIALQDRPQQQWINRANASPCLLTANLGFRRTVFDDVGLFSPEYPRNQDRELELRMWRAGKQGLYLPSMDVLVDVPPERLAKRYHRRWQATTGKYHARLRFRDIVDAQGRLNDEDCKGPRVLGTPLFLYRECLMHAFGWLRGLIAFDGARRFYHETRLWYFVSFFWTRLKTDVFELAKRRWMRPVAAASTSDPR